MSETQDNSKPFFVVFDTATQAPYYSDVHEALARPEGSILRYEYKRYMWDTAAAEQLKHMLVVMPEEPVKVLIIYGEKNSFVKDDSDPDEMLGWEDSKFIPMRCARIVNVAMLRNPSKPSQDKLLFHMELDGFLSPSLPELEPLIKSLEAKQALPFGDREKQYCWVTLVPGDQESIQDKLHTRRQDEWPNVVDAFVTKDTQFKDDVFWRVRSFERTKRYPKTPVLQKYRSTNTHGDRNSWHKDYILHEHQRYELEIETHSPEGYSGELPANSSVRLTPSGDDNELLKPPSNPMVIVPNESATTGFSVDSDDVVDRRYVAMQIETQVPDHQSSYPPGSIAQVTFVIEKDPKRYFAGILFAMITLVLGLVAATVKDNLFLAIPIGLIALITGVLAGFAFTNKLKFPGGGS